MELAGPVVNLSPNKKECCICGTLFHINMLLRLSVVFLILFQITIFAQDLSADISESDLNTFTKFLKQKPLTQTTWEKLRQNALICAANHDFDKAQLLAAKAKLIAIQLNDGLLIARSWHLAGKVYPQNPKFAKQAVFAYEESYKQFNSLEKTLDSRKYAGYLFNDWMFLFIDPDYTFSEHSQENLTSAFKYLFTIHQMINKYPTPDKKELEILTAINISNCFYHAGHLPAQLIWLEYAKSELEKTTEKIDSNLYFQINLRLQKAYRRFGEYQKAFTCLKNLENYLIQYPNDYLKLDYLFNLQDAYNDIRKTSQMFKAIDDGIMIAKKLNYRLDEFYAMKIKLLLQEERMSEAKECFLEFKKTGLNLEKIDLAVINAVFAGFDHQEKLSDEYFLEAHRILKENLSNDLTRALFLLNWEATIANFQKRYEKLDQVTKEYLAVASEYNQKDSLPWIYMTAAKAQIGLGKNDLAQDYLQKAINYIEDKRKIESAQASIGVMEVLFEAYQLKIELGMNQSNFAESFGASELLKSRWLQDKISNTRLSTKNIDEAKRAQIFSLSKSFLEKPFDPVENSRLFALESETLFANNLSQTPIEENNLIQKLENSPLDSATAVVTFAFTSHDLLAFVYRKGEKLRAVKIPLTLSESDKLAISVQQKIKTDYYFKKNGKEIYDLLLQPLKIEGIKHLVIIPDKSLWKIPFQALSADGNTFLIENTRISYAPSVAILLNEISMPVPDRKSFQVFSNAQFDNYFLQYADLEAKTLAAMYGVQPVISSTVNQFTARSGKSDIIHFSMHAEFDAEPFNSFLAFSKTKDSSGKLTVNDLLNLKLKDRSLVFLASCSTNNVFSSEGLVSLAWGMMGAGASTVISAQWDANDESTEQFTKRFYKNYRSGISTAEALQRTSIEMIREPGGKLSKPFYWAEFTLNGDYR